jgi:hypothetical protein
LKPIACPVVPTDLKHQIAAIIEAIQQEKANFRSQDSTDSI